MSGNGAIAVREATPTEVVEAVPYNVVPVSEQRVNIGKIPGAIHEVAVSDGDTIRTMFAKIGIKNIGRCEIQRNGQMADLDDSVEAGDTILAITKIRGN